MCHNGPDWFHVSAQGSNNSELNRFDSAMTGLSLLAVQAEAKPAENK